MDNVLTTMRKCSLSCGVTYGISSYVAVVKNFVTMGDFSGNGSSSSRRYI